MNKTERAESWFDQAIKLLPEIEDSEIRSEVLSTTVAHFAKQLTYSKLRTIVKEADRNPQERVNVLLEIAKTISRQSPDLAEAILREAAKTASRIPRRKKLYKEMVDVYHEVHNRQTSSITFKPEVSLKLEYDQFTPQSKDYLNDQLFQTFRVPSKSIQVVGEDPISMTVRFELEDSRIFEFIAEYISGTLSTGMSKLNIQEIDLLMEKGDALLTSETKQPTSTSLKFPQHSPVTFKEYNLAVIRRLLLEAFTVGDLSYFCFDIPDFRPVYNEFSPAMDKAEMVHRILTFCHKNLLIEKLLQAVKKHNPPQFDRFEAELYS